MFQESGSEFLDRLVALLTVQMFASNKTLVREGDRGMCMFFVCASWVAGTHS